MKELNTIPEIDRLTSFCRGLLNVPKFPGIPGFEIKTDYNDCIQCEPGGSKWTDIDNLFQGVKKMVGFTISRYTIKTGEVDGAEWEWLCEFHDGKWGGWYSRTLREEYPELYAEYVKSLK